MRLDERLQAVAALVPKGSRFADIGTDHAYLPVWLVEQGLIPGAVAGDIATGPCQAARATVAMHGAADKIAVRQGSGLAVLAPGEVDCIAICGMGGSTIISILEADRAVAQAAQRLVLQPMAGAAALRRYLVEQGWQIVAEDLVDDPPHFYEIICTERGGAAAGVEAIPASFSGAVDADPSAKTASTQANHASYSEAEYLVGPALLQAGHPLLEKQIARQKASLAELLTNMARSERAKASAKYAQTEQLLEEIQALQQKLVK